MKIPYGVSSFEDIRSEGFFYVDKTPFLPVLESAESGYRHLLFVRPRRMGKSLLLSMMEHYYDLARADRFDALFQGLWVHQNPTPGRNKLLVLRLDFSGVATDRGPDALLRTFLDTVRESVYELGMRYRGRFPAMDHLLANLAEHRDPESVLGAVMSAARVSGQKLYVLIDEYDHFANLLLSGGAQDLYDSVVLSTGFVRSFYAKLKAGTGTGAVARIFVTGVSPILLDDLSSGFNIVANISAHARFNALAGFTRADVERAVTDLLAESGRFAGASPTWDRGALLDILAQYYDGYRFSPASSERIFNSDMVLYFLRQLENEGALPSVMLDPNVRTDYRRLQRMSAATGTDAGVRREVLQTVLSEGHIDSPVVEQFGAKAIPSRDHFVSLLAYLGMLTLGETPQDSAVPRLVIPNRVMRELSWEHLAAALAEQHHITIDTADLELALREMATAGDIGPFVELFHERAVRAMGLKDLRKLDERALKLMLVAFISLSRMFHVLSEKEFAQGYCDLFLGASRHVPGARYAWMLELKYVSKHAGKKAIEAAFTQAEAQLARYASDSRLLPMLLGDRALKAGTLVFVGASEVLFRPFDGPVATA